MHEQGAQIVRGGHHCTMPLHRKLGLVSTARASFHLYDTKAEVEYLVASMAEAIGFFGR